MAQFASARAARFYAETYDGSVSDWPSEIDFYLNIARQACIDGSSVLELGYGTGRVAIGSPVLSTQCRLQNKFMGLEWQSKTSGEG